MIGLKFEKVSYEQFKEDLKEHYNNCNEDEIKCIYDNIQLPQRATKGSAGYDFKAPYNILLEKNQEYIIPTGIRVKMPNDIVLKIYPRSGLGFKFRLQLNNTVGIIDSDYYYSDNEGHILIKISYTSGEYHLPIKQGQGIAQGVFGEYITTEDDVAEGIRNGGFGSTTK